MNKQYGNKIERSCLEIVQDIECCFKGIDNYLDQILKESQNSKSDSKASQLNIQLPNFSLLNINNQQFPNQMTQQVTSLIKTTIDNQLKNKDQSFNQQLNKLNNLQPFTYNLISNNSIKQDNYCLAIAINKDNSIVIAGCKKDIKVFEFKQEQLKQTQLLTEHTNDVSTLNFMKKSNQFISGSHDNSIIIWSMNQNNQWICKQKLNGHSSCILSLILNNNEDIIISDSRDKSIKFWMKQNEWICSQTITDHTNYVTGLSINDQQNKVISCGLDNFILIIEQSSQNQQWNVIQKITVQQSGYRICFINNDVFIFQPFCKEQMHIYEINNTNKQYSKTKDIIVKCGYSDDFCLFPQQYIKQKCLIVNKNGYNINLIRKKENGDFIIEQSIDFGTSVLFGFMSDNGQYLFTWDNKQREIQIRKYVEK